MFSKSANYYDEIYTAMDKDYAAEAEKAHQFISSHKRSSGNQLLDVACGTGLHADQFRTRYQVEGLDLDAKMLSVARRKYPAIKFHRGDMISFNLRRQFDIIVCLFSSIGYVKTVSKLHRAVQMMGRHLVPGGVLLVEPWFTPQQWGVGRVGIVSLEKPDHKIVRMSRSAARGKISIVEFEYLIGSSDGIEHYSETHELGLFTHEEYLSAFQSAGLEVVHNAEGLDGRGLYIGIKANRE
jgi:ubiquinone/menaquinone biosynthesis C-methylase UbiE